MQFYLKAEDLVPVLRHQSKYDKRPVLNGVFLEFLEGNKVAIVATDGQTMGVCVSDAILYKGCEFIPSDWEPKVVKFETKAINAIKRQCTRAVQFDLTHRDTMLVRTLPTDQKVFECEIIKYRFPLWREIIPNLNELQPANVNCLNPNDLRLFQMDEKGREKKDQNVRVWSSEQSENLVIAAPFKANFIGVINQKTANNQAGEFEGVIVDDVKQVAQPADQSQLEEAA